MLSQETDTHRHLFRNGIPAECGIQDKKVAPKWATFLLSKSVDVYNFEQLCLTLYPLGGILVYMKYMDDKNKAKVVRRLKLLEGQVRGLQKMVENDTYCIDVITQTSAVKQGLSNVEDLLLENHLDHCVHHQMKTGQTAKAKAEIIKVYKLKRK